VPKNCKEFKEVSVNISVSCLVLYPVITLEPPLTLKNPAELVAVGFHSSGTGPVSALTSAHLINSGS